MGVTPKELLQLQKESKFNSYHGCYFNTLSGVGITHCFGVTFTPGGELFLLSYGSNAKGVTVTPKGELVLFLTWELFELCQ